MKKILVGVLAVGALGAVLATGSIVFAKNPAGGKLTPECEACVERIKQKEGCNARDIHDPKWTPDCARALVRALTECKRECE
jgi:hypothetical protein